MFPTSSGISSSLVLSSFDQLTLEIINRMENIDLKDLGSRRVFLKTTASLVLGQFFSKRGLAQIASNGRLLVYVGSYTSAIDGGSNGKGIYRFEVDARTGAMTGQRLVAETPNPSWIVRSEERRVRKECRSRWS